MAINSVDMTKALKNEAYAAQVLRSGKCSAGERMQIAAQWGSEKVAKWESVDSTQYEITEDDKVAAKVKGAKRAEDGAKTDKDGNVNNEDFDGKADNTKTKLNTVATGASVATTGAASVAAAIAAIAKAEPGSAKAKASGFLVMASGAFLLAQSLILKAIDPNSEQAQACDNMKSVLSDANDELEELGSEVSEITNEITDDTDELVKTDEESEKNKETAEKEYQKIQERQQELVAKYEASKNGGEPFTSQDKAELDRIGELLPSKFDEINNIAEVGNEKKINLSDNIEDNQESYDSLGEKIVEVQEITASQAEYDQATVDNAKEVKTAARIGEVASGITLAAGALHAWKVGSLFDSAEGFAALAGMASAVGAGVVFENVIQHQKDYQSRAEAGVENRKATEELNAETNDNYEADLDTLAYNTELNEEVIFEETSVSEPTAVTVGEPAETNKDSDETKDSNLFLSPQNNETAGVSEAGNNESSKSGDKDDKDKNI